MARFSCLALAVVALAALSAPCAEEEPSLRGRTVSQWLTLLHDPQAKVEHRRVALVAMGIFGAKVKGVVPGVVQALRDDAAAEVREGAARTLGQMGPEAKEAVEALAGALCTDKDEKVREAAATALGRLGPAAKGAVPSLAEALKDKSPSTRAAAAETLGYIGPEAATALTNLLDALKDAEHPPVRSFAAFALGRLGPEGRAAVPHLAVAATQDDRPEVRRAAVELAAPLWPRRAGSGGSARQGGPGFPRWTCAGRRPWPWANSGPLPRSAARPHRALEDSDKFVRGLAIHTIGSIGKDALGADTDVAVRALAGCLKDAVVEIRIDAAEELGNFGPAAREAIPALTLALKDVRQAVRESAAEALKRVQAKP